MSPSDRYCKFCEECVYEEYFIFCHECSNTLEDFGVDFVCDECVLKEEDFIKNIFDIHDKKRFICDRCIDTVEENAEDYDDKELLLMMRERKEKYMNDKYKIFRYRKQILEHNKDISRILDKMHKLI